MPLIVPPVFNKEFSKPLFQSLWKKTVAALSEASQVFILGYSLADADFHARFVLRCGFFDQVHRPLRGKGPSRAANGPSQVTIVDLDKSVRGRIEDIVGRPSTFIQGTIEEWVKSWQSKAD